MYRVMVEERIDETSNGPYEFNKYECMEDAHREARTGKMSYPYGAVWVENELGEVIPDPLLEPGFWPGSTIKDCVDGNCNCPMH